MERDIQTAALCPATSCLSLQITNYRENSKACSKRHAPSRAALGWSVGQEKWSPPGGEPELCRNIDYWVIPSAKYTKTRRRKDVWEADEVSKQRQFVCC